MVMLSVLDVPLSDAAARSGAVGAAGAVLSMVMFSAVEMPEMFPAVSVLRMARAWAPLDNVGVVKVQLPLPSTMAEPNKVMPS